MENKNTAISYFNSVSIIALFLCILWVALPWNGEFSWVIWRRRWRNVCVQKSLCDFNSGYILFGILIALHNHLVFYFIFACIINSLSLVFSLNALKMYLWTQKFVFYLTIFVWIHSIYRLTHKKVSLNSQKYTSKLTNYAFFHYVQCNIPCIPLNSFTCPSKTLVSHLLCNALKIRLSVKYNSQSNQINSYLICSIKCHKIGTHWKNVNNFGWIKKQNQKFTNGTKNETLNRFNRTKL